jgi:hypothetical protein
MNLFLEEWWTTSGFRPAQDSLEKSREFFLEHQMYTKEGFADYNFLLQEGWSIAPLLESDTFNFLLCPMDRWSLIPDDFVVFSMMNKKPYLKKDAQVLMNERKLVSKNWAPFGILIPKHFPNPKPRYNFRSVKEPFEPSMTYDESEKF